MSGMALNKRGNVFMENQRIYFFSKFVRIVMNLTLLVIPILIYVLIVNFEISGLILIIFMSSIIIYFCYFLNTYGFNINENEVIYEGENVLMKKGVVVRHLVIPGQSEDSKNVLRYLYETYGDDIWISVMSQYTPVGRFGTGADADSRLKTKYPELTAQLDPAEYDEVVDYAIELGIENCMIQEGDTASDSFIPVFDGSGI